MPTNLYLGDSAANTTLVGASDGALTIQSGAFGAKVNALQIDAAGNLAVAGNLTAVGNVTAPGFQGRLTAGGSLTLGTAQATTSGTSIDFVGIPAWVKRITVMFNGVSLSGTSSILIQLGDSGGFENTSYVSTSILNRDGTTPTGLTSTAGFVIVTASAPNLLLGTAVLTLVSGNTWMLSSSYAMSGSTHAGTAGGNKTLSDTLTQVRITTVNGTDTFDAGSINIMYEG